MGKVRGVGVAVALVANAAFLPAIGMGTGAPWGAAGIQGAPRVQRALFFFPFSFPSPPPTLFCPFGSSNVRTLLVQKSLGTVPIPHTRVPQLGP